MIIGVDNIIDFLRLNNCTRFQLRTAPDKDAFIFKPQPDETFEGAIQRFRDTMKIYAGEKFYLEGWEKDGQTKNWFRTWCKADNAPASAVPTVAGFQQPQGISTEELDRRINEAVTKTQMQFRLESLERENNDLKKEHKEYQQEKSSLQTQFLQRATPYVGAVLGKMFPSVAVAGLEDGAIPAQETEQKDYAIDADLPDSVDEDRLSAVLGRLFAVEPDLLLILEALANKAEQNPSQYQMYKPMILNFLKS